MKKFLIYLMFPAIVSSCLCHADSNKTKTQEKSYLNRLRNLYDEKVETGKKLYGKNLEEAKKLYSGKLVDGKKLTLQTKDWLKQDVEKMGDWEYKVVTFAGKNHEELEKNLNQLGNERWQCFWVEGSPKEKVFYFKRTKMSYINKIPAADLIRIIGVINSE